MRLLKQRRPGRRLKILGNSFSATGSGFLRHENGEPPTASEWHFGDPARVDGHHSHAYTVHDPVVHLDRLPPSLLSSSATEQVIMFSDALAMFVCGWFGPGCERGFRGSSVAATRLFAVGPAWITPRTRSLLPCCRIFVWESFDSRPVAVSHSLCTRCRWEICQALY